MDSHYDVKFGFNGGTEDEVSMKLALLLIFFTKKFDEELKLLISKHMPWKREKFIVQRTLGLKAVAIASPVEQRKKKKSIIPETLDKMLLIRPFKDEIEHLKNTFIEEKDTSFLKTDAQDCIWTIHPFQ